jgi:hypothetical protein
MRELAGATGVRYEGSHGLGFLSCLQRDVFLVAVDRTDPRGFLSIYSPYPRRKRRSFHRANSLLGPDFSDEIRNNGRVRVLTGKPPSKMKLTSLQRA